MIKATKHLYRVLSSKFRERKKSKKRSSHWDETRDAFLKSHPSCAACGGTKHLQVHHIRPFHLYPQLELEGSNLLTLCMGKFECHLRLGHGDDFQCYNPNVDRHVLLVLASPVSRPEIERIARAVRKRD